LATLKGEPPQAVRALAAALDITPMAVRQHLVVLERDGLVQRGSRKRPLGRPESVYALTPAARRCFPDHHDSLACELLESVRDGLGAPELERTLETLLAHRLRRGRERVRGSTLPERLRQLTALQDEHGFMASCDLTRGEIVQRHCTVCAAAETFPALCSMEQKLFEGLLGVPVQRVEHVLEGGAACRYRCAVAVVPERDTPKPRQATRRAPRRKAGGSTRKRTHSKEAKS
jgi:predicted ArsR family transcriptional regulator